MSFVIKKQQKVYFSQRGCINYQKSRKRLHKERKRKIGFKKFVDLLRKQSKLKGKPFLPPTYKDTRIEIRLGPKPEHDEVIRFLIPKYKEFSNEDIPALENGHLPLPERFSLSENHEESMFFLKRLFHLLYKQTAPTIVIDYINCSYLDVDASACMDLILAGFINYYNKCQKKGHPIKIDNIRPINIKNEEVLNVLFSIGAYKNLKGFELQHHTNFIPFSLRIGDNKSDKKGTLKEIHETEIVDYVLACVGEMGRTLTADAESHLSKVVGEVMANAEEHSNFRFRYAIGYFLKPTTNNSHLGTFKLAIFNFGQTIYESFKRPECQDFEVVKQMKGISEDFTKKGFFKKAEYEEQTLWTLYALQEGVTSTKDWKRGKGTIRFIDRFFRLKGGHEKDSLSKLTMVSGNTRIIFDGSYPLIEVIKGNNKKYQMMTFNDSGNIHNKPNDKYVTFVPQYFPGTLISAKICLTYNNIEKTS